MAGEGQPPVRKRPAVGSVRARTTAGATLVVGIALLAASVALVVTMQHAMENDVTGAATLRARDLVASLQEGQSPSDLVVGNDDDVLIQIAAATGEVLASSSSLNGDPPIIPLSSGEGGVVEHPPIADDDPFVVVTDSAHTQGGLVTVLVGRNLDLVRETITNVTHGLVVGVPILVLIVGFTTWSVVGRALAPVESMRKEVTRISETELHRRVSDPPGRDEISRLATTMNEMLARLEVAHDRQQRLVSDAAHELRNPIASIRHHAEVALAHPDRTALEAVTAEILAEDLRLQRLVEDLLLLARADEHALELNARPVDVDDLVLEEARRLGRTTELRVDIAGVTAARTQGDATQLQRVVRNLADNAARHAGSTVRFSLQETDGHIRLEVEDDGPGIPTKDREVVFERFARLDDARDREHGGAGLGLAIAREIVAAHGGETWVVDASLGGACLVVQLPLIQPTPL